jgi:hypothetical protein
VPNALGTYEAKVHRSTYFNTPNLQVEFHFHIYVSLLIIGVIKAQDVTRKHDQPIVYASKLLNCLEWKIIIVKNLRHYLWCLHGTSLNIIS